MSIISGKYVYTAYKSLLRDKLLTVEVFFAFEIAANTVLVIVQFVIKKSYCCFLNFFYYLNLIPLKTCHIFNYTKHKYKFKFTE